MKKIIIRLLAISIATTISACNQLPIETSSSLKPEPVSSSSRNEEKSSSSLNSSSSKKNSSSTSVLDNNPVTLSTSSGLSIEFVSTGAAINSVKYGNTTIASNGFTVGRCANRIANGQFVLNGKTYNVSKNNGNDSLHGGDTHGNWKGTIATSQWSKIEQTKSSVTYTYHSADGENGYPGNMDLTVKYTLSQTGELLIEYSAESDKDTLCNPTNHLFIDINGSRSYNNLKLWIDADQYTPRNGNLPNGQIVSVAGTQFDYRTEKTFDSSKSYDDNLVLNATEYAKVATLSSTKYKVDVFTDRPGLQLYKESNGNICLESQMFPDAINQKDFEDPILKAGETFSSKTAYCFSKLS